MKLGVERIDLPPDIDIKCRNLLRTLELSFGCIDMIVTPAGEWVFLEINQMGQFLWIEEANPNVKLLDLFVQFLIDPSFSAGQTNDLGLRLADFSSDIAETLRKEELQRVRKPTPSLIN